MRITRRPTVVPPVGDVEDIIGDFVQRTYTPLPPPPSLPVPAPMPLPEYVENAEGIDDVGRLSAQALVMSYEASAKQIEEMGQTLVAEFEECDKQCKAMLAERDRIHAETEESFAQCKAAAQVYREQAKEVFDLIQRRAIMNDRVRRTCADVIGDLQK